jgi:hypothetical protein
MKRSVWYKYLFCHYLERGDLQMMRQVGIWIPALIGITVNRLPLTRDRQICIGGKWHF